MGASRRLFVRSDEEDEGGGNTHGDGEGPSTRSASRRKSTRLSAGQIVSESHNTAGKAKKFKRLKRTMEKEAKDFDSDLDEEESDCEEMPETEWRQKWFQEKEDKEPRGDNSKWSSLPSVGARKRKQRRSTTQKTFDSNAQHSLYGDRIYESTHKQIDNDAQILLGEEFEQLFFQEALDASKETYTNENDLPERFQMHEQILTTAASREDWTKEAHWIYNRLFGDPATIAQDEDLKLIADIDKEDIIQEIIFVLLQLHVQKCEVPIIGMYKFQGCTHLAQRTEISVTGYECEGNKVQMKSFKALWMIFQWDRKWLSLLNCKNTQEENWKNRAMIRETGTVAEDMTLDVLIQALQDADSEVAVDDLDAKFNLQFPIGERAPLKGQYKRPKRQSFYTLCCKSGLRQLVRHLGLMPEQLGENLNVSQKIHEPLDCDVAPEEIDLSCVSGQFTELHNALAGIRHVAAYELICEPRVRNFVRSLFCEHAVVSTRPTLKGKDLIDAFHEFACVKFVRTKPAKSFDDGQWLLIQKAEEEELLEVFIEFSQEVFDAVVMRSLQESYFSNASSNELAELWNEQRKLTLQEAVSQMVLPLLVKEMRISLTARAKAWVQAECHKSLWKRVSMAPFDIKDPLADASTSSKASNDAENARVLACCWGYRNPPTTFVMLDAFGQLVDTLQTGYLNVYPGSHEQQLQRKLDDQDRLQKFILLHHPNVIVVGAVVNLACRHLKDTIAEVVGKAAEVNSGLTCVPVIYGDESLASLYEKSQVSLMQLPKQPSIIRRAVALGRNLQNPLALIAALCNPSKDIVALSLHPMQRFLSAEELYTAIECVMITATNQVGVDVNLAVAHEWFFSPLQFVCGLGWKKASMIQQHIQELRWLPSREFLFRRPFSLRDVVFRNCSGFLRVRRVAHAISGLRKLDPLDDTRIHPEYYELAQNLATYAFTNGQASLHSEKDTDMIEQAIVHIRQNPDVLTEETIMSFSNFLQEAEHVNIETLKDIRAELLCGFSDYRAPYAQPTQDEEFSWLTGEDDTSLSAGKAVNAIVHKVFRHRVICILESGIRGVLEKEDFTSDSNVDLTQVFSEGSSLTCCIGTVLKDQFSVQLTCLGNMEAHDYDVNESPVRRGLFSHSSDNGFKPRDIQHPLFQNVSIPDAIKALSDKNPGQVIFHPSSEGPACLSMTVKCQDNMYLRKEIEELQKDSTDLVTFLRLGNILKIDGRNFNTLDEVVTSYASPLIDKMNEVVQSRRFQSINDGEVRSFLDQEKQISPDSLVYCLSMCPNNPGAIAISYMVDEKVHREKIDLYPEGYGLQGKMFRKIDTIVDYIKKTVNEAGCRWVGRDEERDKPMGDGTGRGRGGRYGSGRRDRGYEGRGGRGGRGRRGGRGNNTSEKWGAQNGGSNSGGSHMDEHNKDEEQGFNNWPAAESNGWNERSASFEVSKSQDESGWGRGRRGGRGNSTSGMWGVQNSGSNSGGSHMDEHNKDEEEGFNGCPAAESNGWNEQKASFELSKSQDESGWGVADGLSEKSQSGWGADDSGNTKKCGWGVADGLSEKSQNRWGADDSEDNKKSDWGVDASLEKGQTGSGWEDESSQEKLIGSGRTGKGMLFESQSGGGAKNEDLWTQNPSGENSDQSKSAWGDDVSSIKNSGTVCAGGSKTQEQNIVKEDLTNNSGLKSQVNDGWDNFDGSLEKSPIDSAWGGDGGSVKNSETVCAWGSKTHEQNIVEDLTNRSGWQASKNQVDDGWGNFDSSMEKSQTGDGWGNDNVLSQKDDRGGWEKDGGTTHKAFDASGWGRSNVCQGEGSSGGSGTRTTMGWVASEGKNNNGWEGSNDNKWPEDDNQSGRRTFRGGEGRGRGMGRGGSSSGWTQNKGDDMEGGFRSHWSQREGGGSGRGGRSRGRGRSQGESETRGQWSSQSEGGNGRGGRGRWSQGGGGGSGDTGGWP